MRVKRMRSRRDVERTRREKRSARQLAWNDRRASTWATTGRRAGACAIEPRLSGRRAGRRARGRRSGGAARSDVRARARTARPANLSPSPRQARDPRPVDDPISRARETNRLCGCHVSPARAGRESRTCDTGSAARLRTAVRTALAPVCMIRCIVVFVVSATPSASGPGSGARRRRGFSTRNEKARPPQGEAHVLTECPYGNRSRADHARVATLDQKLS